MSRGGRGGGGLGRMGGQLLPFEVDADLEAEIAKKTAEQNTDEDDLYRGLMLPSKIKRPMPPTRAEQDMVQSYRARRAAMRTNGTYEYSQFAKKRSRAEYDAFEDAPTYDNSRQAKPDHDGRLPKSIRLCMNKELFPKELWSCIDSDEDSPDDSADEKAFWSEERRKKAGRKQTRLDADADVDENGGNTADAANALDADAEDREPGNAGDGEADDGIDEPRDDDFSEDDDDVGNDYNAEKYFDDGEDGDDDGGGDDGGDDW